MNLQNILIKKSFLIPFSLLIILSSNASIIPSAYSIEPIQTIEKTNIKAPVYSDSYYREVIRDFYTAFQNGDVEGMVKNYHPDVEFEDPAFGKLKGERAKDMWRMLHDLSKGNIQISFGRIRANGDTGSAHWEAIYKFSQTGRDVHNKIDATFEFKDGKIYRHKDNFDLYTWSKMAFGPLGSLVGSTSFFKEKLNVETDKQLTKYIENKNIKYKD